MRPEAPRPVVDDPRSSEPAKPGRRFFFSKNLNPDEPVEAGGTVVRFHRPILPGGAKASHGTFETRDASLAEALRSLAVSRPTLYVFETQVVEE